MIESNSDYLRNLPEQYFRINKDEKSSSDALEIILHRIDVMIDLLLHHEGDADDIHQDIAFILEGMIYQAKEMAGNLEV